MAALILCYVFCGWLVTTHFGRVCVGVRENELRAELLGYDSRLYKLCIFTISAGIAAIGGVLAGDLVTLETRATFTNYIVEPCNRKPLYTLLPATMRGFARRSFLAQDQCWRFNIAESTLPNQCVGPLLRPNALRPSSGPRALSGGVTS